MNLTILLNKACIIIELCLKISHFCLARDEMHQHVQQLCTLSITFQSKLRFVFSQALLLHNLDCISNSSVKVLLANIIICSAIFQTH